MKSKSTLERPSEIREDDLEKALRVAQGILDQREWRRATRENTIFSAFEVGKLANTNVDWISHQTPLKLVDELIHDFGIEFFPVKKDGEYVGYVKQEKFRALLGQNQYSRNIFLRAENTVVDVLDSDLVIVDARTPLPEVSRKLMSRSREQLYDPFVITYHNEYYGVATVKSVMDGITYYEQKDIAAAREAQQAMNFAKRHHRGILVDYDFMIEQLTEVGGDFVYAQALQPQLTLFSLMDVSGKGLKAAQLAMAMGAYFRSTFKYLCKTKKDSDFRSVKITQRLKILNTMLTKSTPTDMYASGVVFLLDTTHNILLYFDFGHTPAYLVRSGKVIELPRPTHSQADGFPFFGIDVNTKIKSSAIRVRSGDMIFVSSDGVGEARNELREEFGEDGIKRAITASVYEHPADMIESVSRLLKKFRGEYRKLDDISMLAFMVP